MPLSNNDCEEFFLFEADEIEDIIRRSRLPPRTAPEWARGGVSAPVYKIAPPVKADYRWIKPGNTVRIGPYGIDSGFFYFGTSMTLIDGSAEIALVNPDDYDDEYCAWLERGRSGNACERIIFLFLYGIERRVLEDAKRGIVTREEMRAIRDETEALSARYGYRMNKISAALSRLFQYLELSLNDRHISEAPAPYHEINSGMSAYLRVLFNKLAEEKRELQREQIFEWYIAEKYFSKSKIIYNCYDDFKKLFLARCAETKLPRALKLKTGKESAKLFISYEPASPSLYRVKKPLRFEYRKIAVRARSLEKISALAGQCVTELSRFAASQRELAKPYSLWEAGLKAKLAEFAARKDFSAMPWSEVRAAFGLDVCDAEGAAKDINIALEANGAGLVTNNIDCDDSPAVKFSFSGPVSAPSALSIAAAGLAALARAECAETADADFPGTPPSSGTLKPGGYEAGKLRAVYCLSLVRAPDFRELIRALRNASEKEKIEAALYVKKSLAGCGYKGIVFLEKLYAALKLDTQTLYSHEAPSAADGSLDAKKIKKLRKDTAAVENMLSPIFSDPSNTVAVSGAPNPPAKESGRRELLRGLDPACEAFLRAVSERGSLSRAEAEAAARAVGAPLDGLIEAINEKAFAVFDEPLLEEDSGILRKLTLSLSNDG